jgi:hypothetical protein
MKQNGIDKEQHQGEFRCTTLPHAIHIGGGPIVLDRPCGKCFTEWNALLCMLYIDDNSMFL